MTQRSVQAPAAVIMVRPHCFTTNAETAGDNHFQASATDMAPQAIARAAYEEATAAAALLEEKGVRVHLFDDETGASPDSVFPNNWFSTHPGGHVAIFPMYAPSRRRERRYDIIEMLKRDYRVQDVIDYSGLEPDGLFLEGTGAMVFDHRERIAYSVKSKRTDPVALERFCTHFNYEPMVFDARDERGTPVYHTNVLMCIATEFVMIGLDMIADQARKAEIIQRFEESGRAIINLSHEQIENFAGNALELQGARRRVLALSARAYDSLTPEQIAIVEQSAELLPIAAPTIELSGGSIRCMLAGVHLSPR